MASQRNSANPQPPQQGAAGGAGGGLLEEMQDPWTNVVIPIGERKVIVRKKLGEGGYAYVFLAEDVNNSKKYALKRMVAPDKEAEQLCVNECSMLTKLKHPNIAECYGCAKKPVKNGTEFFVLMELCPGGHLLDIIKKRNSKFFPEQTIANIFLDICRPVQFMHSRSVPIAHRDIKLENYLYGVDNRFKLIDFGSCTTRSKAYITKEERVTEEEIISKHTTAIYRAPEMVNLYKKQVVNESVDVWALGCILYCLAFFVHPFQDSGNLGIANGKYSIPDKHSYSKHLIYLIQKIFTVDPTLRPNINQVMEYTEKWKEILSGKAVANIASILEVEKKPAKKVKKKEKSTKSKTEPSEKDASWGEEWDPEWEADDEKPVQSAPAPAAPAAAQAAQPPAKTSPTRRSGTTAAAGPISTADIDAVIASAAGSVFGGSSLPRPASGGKPTQAPQPSSGRKESPKKSGPRPPSGGKDSPKSSQPSAQSQAAPNQQASNKKQQIQFPDFEVDWTSSAESAPASPPSAAAPSASPPASLARPPSQKAQKAATTASSSAPQAQAKQKQAAPAGGVAAIDALFDQFHWYDESQNHNVVPLSHNPEEKNGQPAADDLKNWDFSEESFHSSADASPPNLQALKKAPSSSGASSSAHSSSASSAVTSPEQKARPKKPLAAATSSSESSAPTSPEARQGPSFSPMSSPSKKSANDSEKIVVKLPKLKKADSSSKPKPKPQPQPQQTRYVDEDPFAE